MYNPGFEPSGVDSGQHQPGFSSSRTPSEGLDLPTEYEAATYGDDTSLAPPQYKSLHPSGSPHRHFDAPLSSINKDEAKQILVEFATNESCYGSKIARELVVTNVENTSAYHYILKTLGESRTTAWKFMPFMPYEGQAFPPHSCVPIPWEIPVSLPPGYVEDEKQIIFPETDTVKICHKCNGDGSHRCDHCNGFGHEMCISCHGFGRIGSGFDSGTCFSCSGLGTKSCSWCPGLGTVTCTVCKGRRQLLHYIQLTVKWKPFEDHHVVERKELPPKLIEKVSGDTVFQEEKPMIQPLSEFWDTDVNSGSTSLFNKHLNETTPDLRIVRQGHAHFRNVHWFCLWFGMCTTHPHPFQECALVLSVVWNVHHPTHTHFRNVHWFCLGVKHPHPTFQNFEQV